MTHLLLTWLHSKTGCDGVCVYHWQECSLCTLRGGALKPTAEPRGQWSHVVCAVTVPEVVFGAADNKEPVLLSSVPRFRQRLVSI